MKRNFDDHCFKISNIISLCQILSPEQKPNKVIGNIIHCLSSGSQLGWFFEPDDSSILVFSGRATTPIIPRQRALTCFKFNGIRFNCI